jgi:hypothetical protein
MFPVDLSAETYFLVISCRYYCGITFRLFAEKITANLFSFSAKQFAGKFPEDFKICRKQLPTKVLASL